MPWPQVSVQGPTVAGIVLTQAGNMRNERCYARWAHEGAGGRRHTATPPVQHAITCKMLPGQHRQACMQPSTLSASAATPAGSQGQAQANHYAC